ALSGTLYQAISAGDSALVSRLGTLQRTLDQLLRIDPAQEQLQELYDTAYYSLQELGERVEEYTRSVEHDPDRLEEIRRRQDLFFRLRTKYGPELSDVIETGRRARAELELIEDGEFELEALQQRERAAAEELSRLAGDLTARRTEAAKSLSGEVSGVLPELGMAGGRFEVVVLPLPSPGPNGAEEIEFRVALNKGFEPKPLAQVASGGEMSRVMLSLKTILARLDSVPTLIFDEVDAGIGGRVALQVGDKMREVARSHQVFAITHLPQIASRAHQHFLVAKGDRKGITTTEVRPLEDEERVREIARMLGGDPESVVSLEHARELLGRSVPAGSS
ncbi:MAG: DNA repair protein RecN, partial [Gemmatimonadota bacterium]|nr:DNA repair protein RecN [Gemmatimonadota bacterium]